MDHRRLQRTLFRMQHDPVFAASLRARDAAAVRSTGLGETELACLGAADPVAVAADRDGRRRAQLLHNVSSEFVASVAVGPDGGGSRSWIEAFPASSHFHGAVAGDRRLPLAFASHAEETAAASSSAEFRALVALDAALARARRCAPEPAAAPPVGSVRRAPAALLLPVAKGTHALAEELHARGSSRRRVDPRTEEALLVFGSPPERPGALRALRVEVLVSLVALFLVRATQPLSRAERLQFAREHGVEPDAVEQVSLELVADGVLLA